MLRAGHSALMQNKQPLWEQPYGKGLVLLMSMFAFLGLMSGWMLLEVDFSDAWNSAGRTQWTLVLQAMLALNSSMCFTQVWLLWTRNPSAVLLSILYGALGVVTQAGMFWYVGQRGQRPDAFSIAFWLAEVIFWSCIVAYLYWLKRRGVLR